MTIVSRTKRRTREQLNNGKRSNTFPRPFGRVLLCSVYAARKLRNPRFISRATRFQRLFDVSATRIRYMCMCTYIRFSTEFSRRTVVVLHADRVRLSVWHMAGVAWWEAPEERAPDPPKPGPFVVLSSAAGERPSLGVFVFLRYRSFRRRAAKLLRNTYVRGEFITFRV